MSADQKVNELKAWHLLLEDDAYRLDMPEDFHQTLLRRADELVLQQVINLEEWQRLKNTADKVYEQTMQALQEHRRDRLDTVSIDLEIIRQDV